MPKPAISFADRAGVPLHYDRRPGAYGTRGMPRPFFMDEAFAETLENCFEALWEACPFGPADVIATAGAWVDKPGAHGLGRGFDIDAIFWPDRAFVTLHYPTDSAFYLAVEAVLRQHFGTVLNYRYNEAHRDHFHIDDLSPVGFVRQHRSRVLFVQMAMGGLYGLPVEEDGRWGPQTAGAVADVLDELGIGRAADPSDADEVASILANEWMGFLERCATTGFAPSAAEIDRSPSELLRHVYELIDRELAESVSRKRVESALTAFAEHPDIASVLEED